MGAPKGWDEGVVTTAPPGWDEAQPQSGDIPISEIPGRAIRSIPKSAYEFGKSMVDPIIHPIRTMEGISKLGSGALGLSEDTEAWDSMKQFFKDRYGSIEGLKRTIADDPVGFMADISTVLTAGGAGAARVPGMVGRVGAGVRAVGEAVNPLSVVSAPAKGLRQAIGKTKLPEDIYARTMKMPPGSLREEGRASVLKTLVREEKMPLGKNTLSNIKKITGELDANISSVLDDLTMKYGSEIDVGVVTKALEDLKETYKNRPNPKPYYEAIDAVKRDYMTHSFVNWDGKITLADAHSLKKGTYTEIQDYYMKRQKPETGRMGIQNDVDAASKAKAAKAIREAVLENPDVPSSVKTNLSRQAGLTNARKWVERATNRGGNLDPISLSGMMFGVLVEGGVSGAVAWHIAKSQPVMSRFSLFLAHGSKTGRAIGSVAKPVSLTTRGLGLLTQ